MYMQYFYYSILCIQLFCLCKILQEVFAKVTDFCKNLKIFTKSNKPIDT